MSSSASTLLADLDGDTEATKTLSSIADSTASVSTLALTQPPPARPAAELEAGTRPCDRRELKDVAGMPPCQDVPAAAGDEEQHAKVRRRPAALASRAAPRSACPCSAVRVLGSAPVWSRCRCSNGSAAARVLPSSATPRNAADATSSLHLRAHAMCALAAREAHVAIRTAVTHL